jgi:hypothetical protein
MAGFRRAKAEQAALKISLYGPPGSGKTFSALLMAEGLAAHSRTRIAFVDTEHGTDFYAMPVPGRAVHPEAFDFDALYSRSLTDVLSEVRQLKPTEHGVIVLDSVTHLWEAAIAAYSGPKTRAGTLPMHAWGKIKKPYKDLMHFLINSPFHVFILGRQANVFEEDEETGETKAAGVKMKAEGETQYEPHICLRMEAVRQTGKKGHVLKHGASIITAFAEKDRSGILQGRVIDWPDFESVAAPLLGLLGGTQAQVQSDDDAAAMDSEALARADRDRLANSRHTRRQFEARFELAKTHDALKAIGKEITPAVKKPMLPDDVAGLKDSYLAHESRLKGQANGNGRPTLPEPPAMPDEEFEAECDAIRSEPRLP